LISNRIKTIIIPIVLLKVTLSKEESKVSMVHVKISQKRHSRLSNNTLSNYHNLRANHSQQMQNDARSTSLERIAASKMIITPKAIQENFSVLKLKKIGFQILSIAATTTITATVIRNYLEQLGAVVIAIILLNSIYLPGD